MINNNVIAKLRKLLALATNNTQKEEMESAMAKAMQIAIEHNIDLSSITEEADKKQLNVIMKSVDCGKRFSVSHRFICWLLQDHFSVKAIYSGSRNQGRIMILVGTETDVEMAMFVYNFLTSRFMSLWHEYHRKMSCPVKHREAYIWGLRDGLHEKLNRLKQGLSPEQANPYAMVLRSKELAIRDAVEKAFPDLTSLKFKSKSVDASAYGKGKVDGEKINIARPLAMAT